MREYQALRHYSRKPSAHVPHGYRKGCDSLRNEQQFPPSGPVTSFPTPRIPVEFMRYWGPNRKGEDGEDNWIRDINTYLTGEWAYVARDRMNWEDSTLFLQCVKSGATNTRPCRRISDNVLAIRQGAPLTRVRFGHSFCCGCCDVRSDQERAVTQLSREKIESKIQAEL